MKQETINTLQATKKVAQKLAKQINPPLTIGLIGGLGAGKTTFVKFLCEALKVKDIISSPTYVLQNIYKSESGLIIDHWDLYRLAGLPEELFEDPQPNMIRLIEWADKFYSETPEKFGLKVDFTLKFEFNGTQRIVQQG